MNTMTIYPKTIELNASLGEIQRFTVSKKSSFKEQIAVRKEVLHLAALSALDASSHFKKGAKKFGVTLLQIMKGTRSKVTSMEASAHISRVIKLALGILAALTLGLLQPEWSLSIYERLSLIEQPSGCTSRLFSSTLSMLLPSSISRRVLFSTALSLAAAVGLYSSLKTKSLDIPLEAVGPYYNRYFVVPLGGLATIGILGIVVYVIIKINAEASATESPHDKQLEKEQDKAEKSSSSSSAERAAVTTRYGISQICDKLVDGLFQLSAMLREGQECQRDEPTGSNANLDLERNPVVEILDYFKNLFIDAWEKSLT